VPYDWNVDQAPIYLVGGDEFSTATEEADRHVLGLLADPLVVILPTAAAEQRPDLAARNGIRYFTGLGAAAEAVMVLDNADADSEKLCSQLDAADLIYLPGGNPARVVDVLGESRALDVIRRAPDRGAIVGGSSAGAMALGPVVAFPGGGTANGLNILNVVTVPHSESIAEERLQQLAGTISRDHAIAAIPSQSACLVTGTRLRNLGPVASSLLVRDDWHRVEPGEEVSLRLYTARSLFDGLFGRNLQSGWRSVGD
jgi:cyanophycinase